MPTGTYIIDVNNASEPADSRYVADMPAELRAIKTKLQAIVNLKTNGAVGDAGVTNNLAAIQAAIVAAAGRTIRVPVDAAGGDYAITSGTLTIPDTARFEYEAGARIYAIAPGVIVDSGRHSWLFGGGTGEQSSEDKVRGINVALLGGNSGTATASTAAYNKLRIKGDTLAGNTKVDGLLVFHDFGGSGSVGGRHAIEGMLQQTGVNDVAGDTHTDRNYVGVAGVSSSGTGDGGAVGVNKGSYFGGNFVAAITSGAMYTRNVTAAEFNAKVNAGASTDYRSGIQIACGGQVRGTTYDASISISSLTSDTTWKNGMLFGAQNGFPALAADSSLIKLTHAAQISMLIDASGTTASNGIIMMDDMQLKSNSLTLAGGTVSSIELGGDATTTSIIDFHSSGNANDYDARISCEGGTTNGTGGIYFSASSFCRFSGPVRPSVDNTITLGSASFRWSQLYAGTATINTSDEREKQQIRDLSAAERAVAVALKGSIRAFKFNDAVANKGSAARIHFGLIAQTVKAAFEAEGLDPFAYAMLCYDEWDTIPEIVDNTGAVTQAARPAGNRYGVRYEELLAFIIAAL